MRSRSPSTSSMTTGPRAERGPPGRRAAHLDPRYRGGIRHLAPLSEHRGAWGAGPPHSAASFEIQQATKPTSQGQRPSRSLSLTIDAKAPELVATTLIPELGVLIPMSGEVQVKLSFDEATPTLEARDATLSGAPRRGPGRGDCAHRV